MNVSNAGRVLSRQGRGSGHGIAAVESQDFLIRLETSVT